MNSYHYIVVLSVCISLHGCIARANGTRVSLRPLEQDHITLFVDGAISGDMYRIQKSRNLAEWFFVGEWCRAEGAVFEVSTYRNVLGTFYRVYSAPSVLSITSVVHPSDVNVVVARGMKDVTVSDTRLKALGDSLNVSCMSLSFVRTSAFSNETRGISSSVRSVAAWSDSVLRGYGEVISGSPDIRVVFASPLQIQRDTEINLVWKMDVSSSVGTAMPIEYIGVRFNGNHPEYSLVQSVRSGSAVPIADESVVGAQPIVRSYPTVDIVPLVEAKTPPSVLIRFVVSASPCGSVGCGQMAFDMERVGLTIVDFTLHGFIDPDFSMPMSIQSQQRTPLQYQPRLRSVSGYEAVNFVFVNERGEYSPIQIPAGTSLYFEVRGRRILYDETSIITTHFLMGEGKSLTSFDKAPYWCFVWAPNTQGISSPKDMDWIDLPIPIGGLKTNSVQQTRSY